MAEETSLSPSAGDPAESSVAAPDYSFWTAEELKRLPSYIATHNSPTNHKITSWLWGHGFRMKDCREMPVRPLWLCCICSLHREPNPQSYMFVATYTQYVEKHLKKRHGIECGPSQKRRPRMKPEPVVTVKAQVQAPHVPATRGRKRILSEMLDSKSPIPDEEAPSSGRPSQWDEKKNQVLLLDWATHHNLPFSIVQSKSFKRLLMYNNPSLREDQIPSADSLIRALDAEYSRALVSVREVLQNARSRIHYTFEGWASQQSTSFLGINAHFIDNQWRQWRIALAVPAQITRHTGDALADEVVATLNSFEVTNSIGYFTVDNASNNDGAVAALGRQFEFDPAERRIRCAPHILNLVAKMMMYGPKADDFNQLVTRWTEDPDKQDEKGLQQLVDQLDELYCLEDMELSHSIELGDSEDTVYPIPSELTAEEMNKCRRSGPFGKLYNIGIHMRQSSQIREAFIDAQHQTNSPDEIVLDYVQTSARWQSDESMVARALSRRRALNRMFSNLEESWLSKGGKPENKPGILNERLSPNEWQTVFILRKILQLFKIASKQLQGDGVSTRGSFDDYFPVIEMLLDHLETANQGHIVEEDDNSLLAKKPLFDNMSREARYYLRIYIKLGWSKLKEYCSKLTSAAYVGSIVFHPCKKWAGVDELGDQLPTRRTANWKKDYQKSLVSIWESDCKNMLTIDEDAPEPRHEAVADIIGRRLAFSRSLSSSSAQPSQKKTAKVTGAQSELKAYLSESPIAGAAYEEDPIGWWRDVGSKQFPKLSYMAVDFLTIPSASTEAGKDFSCRMIAPAGTRLRRHVVGMAQCLRSWSKAGIYQPTLPLGMLEGDNWRDALLLAAKD